MSHTPGPWKHVAEDRPHSGSMRILGPAGEDVVGGCGCCGSPFGVGVYDAERMTEERANAALIAAAPDLLRACKNVLGAFERITAINWDDLARAIAKAEGTA